MRSLMDRWKAVPRVGRDGDDDLWKQFRAAQDVFFAARTESDKARTGEEQANQQQKEELLAEAEKLDPSTDLRGAQNALRKIQERYDAIGHVPRGVMRSLEDRMQAVEQKVRGAADSARARTAPENPMVTSMRAAVTKAEEQLAKAEAAGDERRIERGEGQPRDPPRVAGRGGEVRRPPLTTAVTAQPSHARRRAVGRAPSGGGADPRHAQQDAGRRRAGARLGGVARPGCGGASSRAPSATRKCGLASVTTVSTTSPGRGRRPPP